MFLYTNFIEHYLSVNSIVHNHQYRYSLFSHLQISLMCQLIGPSGFPKDLTLCLVHGDPTLNQYLFPCTKKDKVRCYVLMPEAI